LNARLAGAEAVHVDIGTGDGRYAVHVARTNPGSFVIGLDACRENLVEVSRRAPANSLFVIANALVLPPELDGLATQVSINFPWGSLVQGLLVEGSPLLAGLARLAQPGAVLEVRLNGGALAEAGWSLEGGAAQVRHLLLMAGFRAGPMHMLGAGDLKAFPTSWARRLAYGRDPRAALQGFSR
jgi:16S rRNA (adenine(1408)-N(1))-methyltransferase